MSAPVLLITGTSSGIGLRTAIAAERAGWHVIATMRDVAKAPAELDGFDIRPLDVTSEASIADCFGGIERLDALVNNAGIGNNFPTIETVSMDRYRAGIEVNFLGVVAVTRAAMPLLRASGGRVLSVGSTRGLIAQPFNEAYSAAKFAVEGFMEALAPVAAAVGVTVAMIEAGPVLETSFAANTGVTFDSLLAAAGPYADALRSYLEYLQETGWPGAQPAGEVADVIVRALTEPDPPFRIPTSDWVRDYAALKLVDPEGRAVQKMTRSWVVR
ncbi:SDR family NAD(P)-dependent oxidoreductase [Hamadaea tsunoensis]|uniref:SDR family NAD(P)-dependent oxidoreductase n=1 Tax=Hamadaea tsunoensis TaxID=53368 RepID=UPI000426049E|nr:SDR family NAD(P)-dependent oxidoreductase [Hamadaea tsunoensis]